MDKVNAQSQQCYKYIVYEEAQSCIVSTLPQLGARGLCKFHGLLHLPHKLNMKQPLTQTLTL